MEAVINQIINLKSHHPRNTGLVVGLIIRDQRKIYGYGRANDGSVEPPSGDTLYEVGSITKLFTASLFAILTADGHLNLNDRVRDLMPSLSNLPSEITLLRLASHTSGLPKMPSNLTRSLLQNRRNPYASYTMADLYRYLSRFKIKPSRTTIDQINYSNLGPALLGHVLAHSIGTSYEQAVVSRICNKLAMHDTRITLTPEQKERLAIPHSASGRQTLNWDLPVFAGAGALRSTANDMLKFLAANLGRPQSSLTEILQLCHETRSEIFTPRGWFQKLASRLFQRGQDIQNHHQAVGLGWYVGKLNQHGNQVLWHHGATGGYRAFTGFVKRTETGVVVITNQGPSQLDLMSSRTSADEIGFKVLEYLNSVDR